MICKVGLFFINFVRRILKFFFKIMLLRWILFKVEFGFFLIVFKKVYVLGFLKGLNLIFSICSFLFIFKFLVNLNVFFLFMWLWFRFSLRSVLFFFSVFFIVFVLLLVKLF